MAKPHKVTHPVTGKITYHWSEIDAAGQHIENGVETGLAALLTYWITKPRKPKNFSQSIESARYTPRPPAMRRASGPRLSGIGSDIGTFLLAVGFLVLVHFY